MKIKLMSSLMFVSGFTALTACEKANEDVGALSDPGAAAIAFAESSPKVVGLLNEGGQTTAFRVSISTGALANGHQLLCRHAAPDHVAAAAFRVCGTPGTQVEIPIPEDAGTVGGSRRLEVKVLDATGASLATARHDYYVHGSLNGLARCELGVSDAALVAKAREFIQADHAFGTDTVLNGPFNRVVFDPSDHLVDRSPEFSSPVFEALSLRRRFRLSADKEFAIITREFEGRLSAADCSRGLRIMSGAERRTETVCQALVLNSRNEGVCLSVDPSTHAIGWVQNYEFISGKLNRHRPLFSPKTRDSAAAGGDQIFLPD